MTTHHRVWLINDTAVIRAGSSKEIGAVAYVPATDFDELLHWVERECGSTQCNWQEDEDGDWDTSCSHRFSLNEGTPTENNMKFCCYCGASVIESHFGEQS
jgi:hypothetical protein